MNKTKTHNIVISSIILSLTMVMAYFDYIFLVPMIVVCVSMDFKSATFATFCFIAVSVAYAFVKPSVISVVIWSNIWILIFPRLLVGLATFGVSNLLSVRKRNYDKVSLRNVLAINVCSSIASLTNTVLVVGCLLLFTNIEAVLNLTQVGFLLYILPAVLIELAVTNIIVPPLAITMLKVNRLAAK